MSLQNVHYHRVLQLSPEGPRGQIIQGEPSLLHMKGVVFVQREPEEGKLNRLRFTFSSSSWLNKTCPGLKQKETGKTVQNSILTII